MLSNKVIGHDDVHLLVPDQEYRLCSMNNLDLKGVELTGSKFTDCNFSHSDLTDAKLNDCELERCDLSNVKIAGANLFSTAFRECKLLGVSFTVHTNITSCVFEKCHMEYTSWRGMNLTGMDLSHSLLKGSDFGAANLARVNFTDSDLLECEWDYAKFNHTDVRGAKIDTLSLKKDVHGLIVTLTQLRGMAENVGIIVLDAHP